MDQMYEVVSSGRYVIHQMLHDGAVSRCGRFLAKDLVKTAPGAPQDGAMCGMCASDEAQEKRKAMGG